MLFLNILTRFDTILNGLNIVTVLLGGGQIMKDACRHVRFRKKKKTIV